MKSAIRYPLLLLALACTANAADAVRERAETDEIVYFVLPDRFENGNPANDRGGMKGERLKHGFDPTSKAFFHGGDLQGLTARLDYIQALGATAVWLTPVFKNKPVQGGPGQESAGYHGYWITDFTSVDPHLGDEAQMQAFVRAAHARGMKVYLDIIANHTADVIAYRECQTDQCPYRSRAEYPYSRRGGLQGEPINDGFTGNNFEKLTRPDFAYTPYLPAGEERSKVPQWLNDPLLYHNRGNTTFAGESSEMGDFVGLDDLMTESPRVVQGMIEIYGSWIDRYGVDGFRIDTARHVNPEFWQAFVPAMLQRAAAKGIPHFHIFGEVSTSDIDVALLARYTRDARLPAVLDFAFASAVRATIAGSAGTDKLARLFADDTLYANGEKSALQLPTFISNHDAGRFAFYVRKERPQASDDEVLQRVQLAHAMLFMLRGVPVVYYGDEQGFTGVGGDQDARQDMMTSRTASYLADRRIGTGQNPPNFDLNHPIARAIAKLSALRRAHAALRSGQQIVRNYSDSPGLFAVSRVDPVTGREIAIAFNTSLQPLATTMEVAAGSRRFSALYGRCESEVAAPGSYRVVLAPLDFVVCAAGDGT
ncbi:MAG TPA: alpha-amylase family glycosyl hydrolase [Steroidobacteraceae bacterium]|nr:alpha-amylase family glycosyl hydrolase [Steroidobacteraceae bacterium]